MHAYGTSWTAEEESAVEAQLETLFALQDKNLGKEKKSIWIEELRSTTIPVKAILQGLAQLKTNDVNRLTFGTVAAAARKFIEPEQRATRKCDDCKGRGVIWMRNLDTKYEFVFRCRCENGEWLDRTIVQWDGNDTYMSKKNGLLSLQRY